MHKFELEEGEVIYIGGFPYRHIGDGVVEGGTDPELARKPFNLPSDDKSPE